MLPMPEKMTDDDLPIGEILLDDRLQMREGGIDFGFAEDLAEILREDSDTDLELVTVFIADPGDPGYVSDATPRYYVTNGFHRVTAYSLAKRGVVPAEIYDGGFEAAFRHALGANATQNAKPRTRADLRKAVRAALAEFFFQDQAGKILQCKKLKQVEIAELCRTTEATVSRILKEMKREREPAKAEASTSATPAAPSAGEQIDFWGELSRKTEKVWDVLDYLADAKLSAELWLDEKFPVAQKIAACDAMEKALKTYQARIAERREALRAGGAA